MEQLVKTRVGEKGRILIPSAIREQLGMKVGDPVVLEVSDRELRISTLQLRIEEAQATVRKYISPDRSLADELSAERREAAKHE
jgi:AbrB family looped-hinge helix DNA binding protein